MTCEKGLSTLAATVAIWLLPLATALAQTAPQANHYGVSRGGPAAAGPEASPAMAVPFAPLSAKHQEYLDSILKYWEHSSTQVQRYRCNFKRWEYDSVFGPKDTYKTYAEGVIKYADPDKGLFQLEKVYLYQPPPQDGGQAKYVPADDDTYNECWICDGRSIFEFNYKKKQLIEQRLPQELQGRSITEGPLPFLFGAKADTMKQRYWIRVITPPETQGEYWLEAFPKTRDDAADFQKVHVIIDEQEFLPKALIVFARGYDGSANTSRTTFVFESRDVNWNLLPEKLNLFHREFFDPALPRGWTKVVQDFRQPLAAQSSPRPADRR